MEALVSIYMPTKNRVKALSRALNSILSQTYKNIEVIVVDDGSTDDTYEYLISHVEIGKRLFVLRNEVSLGACEARNIAIRNAKGEFVTGCDDDDEFTADRIEKFIKHELKYSLLRLNEASLLFSKYYLNNTEITWTSPKIVGRSDLIKKNYIGNQVFTLRSNLVGVGGFDSKLRAWQDYECWIRLVDEFGPAVLIDERTYNLDTSQENRISKDQQKIHEAFLYVSKKHSQSKLEYKYLKASYFSYPGVKLNLRDVIDGLLSRSFKRYGDLLQQKYF